MCGEVLVSVLLGVREERRASGRPGADGAVREVERLVRFVVEIE